MKRRLLVGLTILATLLSFVCIFASCSERETPEPDDGNNTQNTETRTVEIICGENRSLREYELGVEIKLKAEVSADEAFVCWLEEGEPFSYERETVYKVTRDAVVRAVYASGNAVRLETDGGTLPENYVIKINAYGGTLTDTDGALLKGYGYTLPVPEKYRYKFVGWYYGETRYTDENGVSQGVYNGGETVFTAVYKENPFVTIVLKNGETGEITEEIKTYIEDGAVRITAPEIVDRQCTGWEMNGETYKTESEFIFYLTDADADKTYELTAKYREAYKLTVIGGSGGGSYTRDEEISVKGSVPAGRNFVEWRITVGGTVYALGRTADGTLCFINGDEAVFYSDEENGTVTVSVDECGAKKSEVNEKFTLAELERTGAAISGGANALIKAEFVRKEFTLTYRIECNVNGAYCLDEEGENRLLAAGFVKSEEEDGVFIKEEYYDYNNGIVLATVPAIEHYKFGNWENADNSGKIPSFMPDGDVSVRGTFVPEKHRVSVSCDETEGSVKIGASGTLSGYYDYGQTITFYVTAEAGYKFGQWLDRDSGDSSDRVLIQGEEDRTETVVYYVYTYRVIQDESFTVRFTARDYLITYILTVFYDGEEVTNNPDFFQSGYKDGYNVTTETRNYGVRGGLKPKTAIGSGEGELDLIYGTDNWTVSEWKADREGLGDLNDFVMPRYDVTVRAVCTINSYTVGFSAQEGVGNYEILSINDKDPSVYASGSTYSVPFGSEFGLTVTVENGYRMSDVKVGGEEIGDESGYVRNDRENYTSDISFVFVKNGRSTVYVFYAERNLHTVTYYVSADFTHTDEDRLLSDYIAVDENDVKTVDGVDYYLVTGVRAANGKMTEITQKDMVYGQQITDPTINARDKRYTFSDWTRMEGDKAYNVNTMPDGSVWAYGRFGILSYSVSVAKNTFKFDDAATPVNTANVNKIVETGETEGTEYEEDGFTTSSHRYFSEITVTRRSPTGYDFNQWKILSHTDGQSDVTVRFDISEAEEGTVYKIVSGGKTFKYRVNGDGTITVYLTENIELEAEFSVMVFTATSTDGRTQIRESGSGKQFASACTFEYGKTLDFSCNYTAIANLGQKITAFVVSETEDMNAETERLSSEFDDETLSYPTRVVITGTTEIGYTCDVFVEAAVEDIEYRIYYSIYSVANSINGLTGTPTKTYESVEGRAYTVKYNETVSLIGDEETKALAENAGLDVSNSMYSGWYTGTALAGRTEGAGFLDSTNTYNPNITYRHTTPSYHAEFICYLVRLVTTARGEAEINDTIKNTTNYKRFASENYTEITVPEKGTDGTSVTVIADEGFMGFDKITAVNMPSTVTKIGQKAFYGCAALEETGLVNAVTEIGANAYCGCEAITEVTIGENIVKIGNGAFSEIPNLSAVHYRSLAAAPSVGTNVFSNSGKDAENGLELIVGTGVSTIVKNLFCSSDYVEAGAYLRTVSFEEGTDATPVTIAGSAFNSSGLTTFNASGRIKEIGQRAFEKCKNLKEIDLKQAVMLTKIETNVFRESGLSEVILPEFVTEIGSLAFAGCVSLVSVYYTTEPSAIGDRAFSRTDNSGNMKLVRITDVSEKEIEGGGEEVIRLENVSSVGNEAFYGCVTLTEAVIGGDNVTLNASVFAQCYSLSKVTYNARIGSNQYESTNNATFVATGSAGCELIIGENVERIPSYAFYGFTVVETLTVPSSVNTIGTQAFGYMSGLTLVNFDIDGAFNAYCTPTAAPFTAAGAPSGMKVVFGENVSAVIDGAFAEARNLTAIEVSPSDEYSFEIGDEAFSGTKISAIYLPVRNGITVGENAFNGAPIVSLVVDEGNETAAFYAGAFGSSALISEMTVNMMGRTMNSLLATVDDGAFTVRKTETGLTGTLVGTMTTQETDFLVERQDTLILSGADTKLGITMGATIRGSLKKENGATIEKSENTQYFKAVAYDKNDFDYKNAFGGYTHFLISEEAEEIAFNDVMTVNAREFEIAANVTFVNNAYLDVARFIVASGIKAKVGVAAVRINGALSGELTATAGSDIVIGTERFINGGSVSSDGYGYGINVVSGETVIESDENNYAYNVTSGEAKINYDYVQAALRQMKISGGALTVAATAVLSSYEAAVGTELAVAETGILRLGGFNEGESALSWTVDAAVSRLNSNIKNYYGTMTLAYTDDCDANDTFLIEKDLDISETVSSPAVATVLDFGNFTVKFNGGGLQARAKLTVKNASATATAAQAAFSGSGEIVIESGTVSAAGEAINASGSVTIGSEATVISSAGNAITAGEGGATITVNGTVTGYDCGVKVFAGSNAVNLVINGTAEGNNAAVYTEGRFVSTTVESGAVIRGEVGIMSVRPSGTTTNSTNLLNVKNGAIVEGNTAGVAIIGAGYSTVNGTVNAASERKIVSFTAGGKTVRMPSGAIVVVENAGSDTNYAKADVGGTATNETGDAVLYYAYDKADSSSASYKAVTIKDNAQINGEVTEYALAYRTYNSGYGVNEVYAVSGNEMKFYAGESEATAAGATGKYSYVYQSRIQSGYALVSDEKEAAGTNYAVRYVTHYKTMEEAFGKKGIIRVTDATVGTLPAGETLIVRGTATVEERGTEIGGTIAVSGGVMKIAADTSVRGMVAILSDCNNDGVEYELEIIGGTTTISGRVDIIDAKISAGAAMTVTSGEIRTEYTNFENNGTFTVENGVSLSAFDEVVFGENSVTNLSVELAANNVAINRGSAVSAAKITANSAITFGQGSYKVFADVEASTLGMSGDTDLTVNGALVLSNAIDYAGGVASGTAITLNGDGNELNIGEIGGKITVGGNTIITTLGSGMDIRGSLEVKEGKTLDISSASVTVKTDGRLIFRDGATVKAKDAVVEQGAGMENHGGELTVSVKVYPGAWLFTANGKTAFSEEPYYEGAEKVSETLDMQRGTVISYCIGEETVTVPPTCGTDGYTGCAYEVRDILSDGTVFTIKHERRDIIPATGEHSWVAEGDKHRCTECNLTEEHNFEYVAAAYIDGAYLDGNNEQMFLLGKKCSACEDAHTLFVIDYNTTERQFNDMNLFFAPVGNSEARRVSALGDGNELMVSKASSVAKFVTDGTTAETNVVNIGGEYYYIVKINVEASGNYYVLVRHQQHRFKPTEDGKHICVGCGELDETPHLIDSAVATEIIGNGVSYGAIKNVCSFCENGDLYSVETTGLTVGTVNAGTITANGTEYAYALTAGADAGIKEAALFKFELNGEIYFALGVTLVSTGGNLACEYAGGFVLPVKCNAAHVCTVAAETKTVGSMTLNVITAICADGGCTVSGGNAYFNLSANPTVGELKETLLGYLLEYNGGYYRIVIKDNHDRMSLKESVFATYEESGVYYDLVNAEIENASTGEQLAGVYYVAVKHICRNFSSVGGTHVCKDCGATNDEPCVKDETATATYTVGEKTYTFVVKKCAICNEGTPIILTSNTVSGLNEELNSVKITGRAANAYGEVYVGELTAYLADDKNADPYNMFKYSIKLTTDGTLVSTGGSEEGTVYGIAYVRFKTDYYYHDGVYAVLFLHKCTDFKSNSDGSGHVCSECGAAYGSGDIEHTESNYNLQEMQYNDETVRVLGKYCSFCGKGSVNTEKATFVSTVKLNIEKYTVTVDGEQYSLSLSDKQYGTGVVPSKTGRSVTVNSKTYYLWEITLTSKTDGSKTIAAYVLIGTN